ncbi:alpha/beta hydrolase [Lutibacter sp.]|uniref:alpha/beta hydrolase n=1 Tax=Lutibacter sp. TaxID=1925666 RepID=UPI0027323A50|nr:alpha/beta hydrolase [Lutibacter sp.]MDP3312728.1 alpha/beta hydrolase [Lutibacter sp.]
MINTPKIKPNNIPKIPSFILITGKTLQFISNRLAIQFVLKLFGTPFKFKTPIREKMMAKSAKQQMLLIPSLKKKVMVYEYGYSTKKVLLIHGWSGRGTQLFNIADKLLENGFMTISFDAPAHGKSSGKTTMMTEFVATALFLEKEFGGFDFAIGHSLGGMTVLNAIKQGLKIKKAVIIGSGDIISDIISDFISKLELKQQLVPKAISYFYNKYGVDIDDYSASFAAKSLTTPVLVIHDTQDFDVLVSCAYNIRQNLVNGQLLITNGLGHRGVLNDPKVIRQLVEFIKK